MIPRPSEGVFQRLVEYKVVTVRSNKYVYSPEFESSVSYLREHPPGRLEQTRMGNKVRSGVIPALVKYVAHINKKKKYVENVIVTYVCLDAHFKRLGMGFPSDQLADIVYGAFYLNDNKPEVESVVGE
jgi:hypothetical protein